MDFDKWKKMLSTVDSKSNVLQKIKDELLKEDQDTYQKWKDNGFNADHKFEPSGLTLLHLAAKYGYTGVAESLIEKGAKLDEKDGFFGYTPLPFAAMYGNSNVAKLLIENGANVNDKGRNGQTSLHLTAIFGKADVAELLIKKGANVDEKDKDERTPLYIATCNQHKKVMEVLVRNGANIGAAESSKINTMMSSVKKGLDTLFQNKDGETTRGLAKEYVQILSLQDKVEEVRLHLINNGCVLRSALDNASKSFKQAIMKKSREDGYNASEEEVDKITIKGNKPVDIQKIIEHAFNQAIEIGKLTMKMLEDVPQNHKNALSKTDPNRYGMVLGTTQTESIRLSSEKPTQQAAILKKSDVRNGIAVDKKDQKVSLPKSSMEEIKTECKVAGRSQFWLK